MHKFNLFSFLPTAERRLIFDQQGPSEQPSVPRSIEDAVSSEEIQNLLDNPEALRVASELRSESASGESRAQVARLSSSTDVRISVEPGDAVDTVLQRGRRAQVGSGDPGLEATDSENTVATLSASDVESMREKGLLNEDPVISDRFIGQGLEVSPEEQTFLLQVETEYRNAFNRASRQPNFNLEQFKQEQIALLSARVSSRTKFQLNPGIPGSFGLGLHTEEAPYKQPTPEQVRVLRGMEQRYNQALQAALRQNGGRRLPPQQLIQLKQQQIARFNQELAQTDISVRLHMGIPESYSFGVDWAGADAQVPPSQLALVGNTEGPAGLGSQLELDPQAREMAEKIMKIIEAILQAILDFIEGNEGGKDSKTEAPSEDLQAEIDRELAAPGMTKEKLREQTASELAESRKEAKDLRGDITTAETALGDLTTKESDLQKAIDNPEEGANVEDLKTQLADVRGQKTELEARLSSMRARLKELEDTIIPRLEQKLALLGGDAESGNEDGPQLTEEQREAVNAKVQELLDQLDPAIRDVLGEFRVGLTQQGEPALFPTSDGILRDIAGEKGFITIAELSDPGFIDRVAIAIDAALSGIESGSDTQGEDSTNQEPNESNGPSGTPENLGDSIRQAQNSLKDYVQHTEDFVQRRVVMYRAHVQGTQAEIDDLSYLNPFNIPVRNALKKQLAQEQRALDEAITALSQIDVVRNQVQAKIDESNDTSKTGEERIQALKDGRQAVEGLRGLIQDVNYAQINTELAIIDDQLGMAETILNAPAEAIGSIVDYIGTIPDAASEIWNQDILPAWNNTIVPGLNDLADWGAEQWDAAGVALKEISDGFAILNQGTASEFGAGYKEQFLAMYGEGMQQLEGVLTDAGVNPTDIAAFKQVVENSFDSGIDLAQDIQDRGIAVVAQEAWDGISQEAVVAWNENIQPTLDNIGDWTDVQLAQLNQAMGEISDGFAILNQGTASEFGAGYKEQFLAMYGEGMQQLEGVLTDAGVNPTDIAAFKQVVESGFDSGIAIADEVRERGIGVVASEMLEGISHETQLAWAENIQPLIDRGLDTSSPEWQTVEAALTSLKDYADTFDAGELIPEDVRPYVNGVQNALANIPNIDLSTMDQMMSSLLAGLSVDL